MKRICEEPNCNMTYDDLYQLTICPHEFFQMHTHVYDGRGEFLGVAHSIEELNRMTAEAERRGRERLKPRP